jgi:AP-3 complex subunit mu
MNYVNILLSQVKFTINQLAVSGLKVNKLDMYGEKYKPFKGVKYITKAGKFQLRM